MKTVTNTENIKLKLKKEELINGQYLPFKLLSQKLLAIEESQNMQYKKLRNKMYNSQTCKKYNSVEIAGITCIDTQNPMKGTASLALEFEVE